MEDAYMHITTQIKEKFKHIISIMISLDFYREVKKWIENKMIFDDTGNYLKSQNSMACNGVLILPQ